MSQPTIYVDGEQVGFLPAEKIQSDYNQTDNTKLDYIKNKPNLKPIALSGNSTDASYDNTISGLTATNTKDAIDEVSEKIPFKLGINNGTYGCRWI